jgi:hypothetical protein
VIVMGYQYRIWAGSDGSSSILAKASPTDSEPGVFDHLLCSSS